MFCLKSLETCIPNVKNHHLKVHTFKLYKKKYMIALTKITNPQNLTFLALLVFKLLNSKEFVYKQKREWKVLRSKLIFKKTIISRVYNYSFANTGLVSSGVSLISW